MKTRVASIVTLLSLVLLGILLTQSCSVLAQKENKDIQDGIRLVCQTSGATMENKSGEERISVLQSLAHDDRDISFGLYNADGSVLRASNGSVLPLAEEDLEVASIGSVHVYSRKNAEGKEAFYAIYQFEDGAFLLLSRVRVTGLAIFLGNKYMLVFSALLLALLLYVLMVLRSLRRKEQLVAQMTATLDAFSEGKYDSRIEGGSDDPDVQMFNAIVGRIQDRVLRQASRNHALSVVMNQMQNGIIAVDGNLKVILVTPVAKKLLGIIGNPEGQLVSEASKDVRLDDVFNEAMRQGGVYTNEVAARTAVGRGHRPLRLYVSPMRNDGQVVGALAMVEDITEIRRLEQVRTDFAANVSHELKTPLTSIRGFVETLENGAIDNPEMAHKFLRIIMLETERLTRLINDILSISKLESGNDEVSIERLRLDKMAYDVADMLSIHAGEKEVTINCHLN